MKSTLEVIVLHFHSLLRVGDDFGNISKKTERLVIYIISYISYHIIYISYHTYHLYFDNLQVNESTKGGVSRLLKNPSLRLI